MLYALLFVVILVLFSLTIYLLFKNNDLQSASMRLEEALAEREAGLKDELHKAKADFAQREADFALRAEATKAELATLRSELATLEKLRHVPGIIERAKRTEKDIEARLETAQRRADQILLDATNAAIEQAKSLTEEAEAKFREATEARKFAEWQVKNLLAENVSKTKEIAASARKEAKEKVRKAQEELQNATVYALEIRNKAEKRAEEIGGQAYEALKRHEFYKSAAKAMQNTVESYGNSYMVPPSHIIDELADEFGFHKAGLKLKAARDRSRIMEKNGTAATCNYPEGWKRDFATNFVLSAFNGKVDSILARVKPANQGRLIQEIKDTYALVNRNGEVFRDARIHEEFLDARLEELKWAVAVQRLKDKDREEQRAIREQMREEEKAQKEYERAIRQAQREEELITKALETARNEFEQASGEEKARLEAKVQELSGKLQEAADKERSLSMAQLTKTGHVYVISNIGSFGEGVFKIGLTRRIEPTDRVRELGDASVPFPFDIHALIKSDEAPTLEGKLHKKFVEMQVNKANRRKEFFRLSLNEIKQVVGEMGLDVKWTITAEAREYRDTLALEQAMKQDATMKRRWVAEQQAFEDRQIDEELVEEIEALPEENDVVEEEEIGFRSPV